jgi:hypothetical protein
MLPYKIVSGIHRTFRSTEGGSERAVWWHLGESEPRTGSRTPFSLQAAAMRGGFPPPIMARPRARSSSTSRTFSLPLHCTYYTDRRPGRVSVPPLLVRRHVVPVDGPRGYEAVCRARRRPGLPPRTSCDLAPPARANDVTAPACPPASRPSSKSPSVRFGQRQLASALPRASHHHMVTPRRRRAEGVSPHAGRAMG